MDKSDADQVENRGGETEKRYRVLARVARTYKLWPRWAQKRWVMKHYPAFWKIGELMGEAKQALNDPNSNLNRHMRDINDEIEKNKASREA